MNCRDTRIRTWDPPDRNRDALRACATNEKSHPKGGSSSGYQDSNLGPPVPKTGALPDCATSRKMPTKSGRKLRIGRDSNPGYGLHRTSV